MDSRECGNGNGQALLALPRRVFEAAPVSRPAARRARPQPELIGRQLELVFQRDAFWGRVDSADHGGELRAVRAAEIRASLRATEQKDGRWIGDWDLLLPGGGGDCGESRPMRDRHDALLVAAGGLYEVAAAILRQPRSSKLAQRTAKALIRWLRDLELL